MSTPGSTSALMVGRLLSIFERRTSIHAACPEHRGLPDDVAGLRIAIANWRDPWHPEAGGAERYAWEIGRRLVARGAQITYLTARAPGQARRSRRDGIMVVRMGGRFTVYPLALGWLLAHHRSFHAVLDCQNGIPFFTPWVLPRRAARSRSRSAPDSWPPVTRSRARARPCQPGSLGREHPRLHLGSHGCTFAVHL